MKELKINANSEDSDDHPAEMQFTFLGNSGAAFGDGERLVEWTGGFPAGSEGAGHLTNADQSVLAAAVPLFVGRESLMSASECREECVALPASAEPGCLATCATNESLGRYNDRLEFGIGGVEKDASPSKAWGVIAGIAAGAASCYALSELGGDCLSETGIGTSVGIGTALGKAVNELAEDDDDELGLAEQTLRQSSNDWGIGISFAPLQFGGGEGGDIALDYEMRRIAAPTLIHYSVSLRSITIVEGYEESGCEPPNEIFVHARADFQTGQSQPSGPIRVPEGDGVLSLEEGETAILNAELVSSGAFLAENAAESPFLYLETSVWERDEDNDLLGFSSEVIELAPIVARFVEFDGTPDNFVYWHGTERRFFAVEGFGEATIIAA